MSFVKAIILLLCCILSKVSLLERWHFPMLNDEARNVSYRKAIELTIEDFSAKQQREGRQQDLVVLDVGTGLSLVFTLFKLLFHL